MTVRDASGALGAAARTAVRRWRQMRPPAFFVASFAALIALGTAGLLALPGLVAGPPLGVLDALFTMTSAVCVTGLVVVDTATAFTFWGQLWILVFIQLGGIGLITLTTAIIGALGGRLSLRSELTGVPGGQRHQGMSIGQLALRVARFTLLIEAAGAAALLPFFVPDAPLARAVWDAVFQSVSAFCNAGFSTLSDSLVRFRDQPLALVVVSLLIVVGGIGFITLEELQRRLRRTDRAFRLSSHTYAVVATTAALLALGTVGYAAFEWGGTLGGLGVVERVVNAWFMSVTARTAGFTAVSYADLGNAAALLTIMLMFVGGSPGSTAGGIKTTTLAVLVALARARTRGRRHVELHDRGIPEGTIERAVSLTLLAVLVLTAAFFALEIAHVPASIPAQRLQFLPTGFEVVSAFSTVGLSMGATAALTAGGKVVIIVLMFVGRVGLLSFFAAVALRSRPPGTDYRPAAEDVIVG